MWSTGFFDKNVVGTANALTGGFGNLGGGITYFVMPAVYNSLVKDGLTKHVAWRVSFIVPGIMIVFVAITMLIFTPDCPTGKWSDRMAAAENSLRAHHVDGSIDGPVVDVPGVLSGEKADAGHESPREEDEKKIDPNHMDHEAQMGAQQMLDTARGEVVQKPSGKEAMKVIFSLQTLVTASCYFCTFGAELSINSILGNYYRKNFPYFTLQEAGNWAAMFGLLNGICRPLGGYVADVAYGKAKNVWAKKILLHTYSIITGAFLLATGLTNSHSQATMFGLVAGVAFFLEGANGMNFALVPHVHPHANGIVSGVTGASGNFGGIIFAIIFRYNGTNYGKVFWIIGVMTIAINLAVSWIKPIPKGQIGGR